MTRPVYQYLLSYQGEEASFLGDMTSNHMKELWTYGCLELKARGKKQKAKDSMLLVIHVLERPRRR